MTGRRERIGVKKARLDRLRPLAGRSLGALAGWYDVKPREECADQQRVRSEQGSALASRLTPSIPISVREDLFPNCIGFGDHLVKLVKSAKRNPLVRA